MINDRALGFSRMGKGPSSLFSIRSRLSAITAVAFAVCNISSWIYRETASIFAVEHNALFELSLKCCAHDSLARPGNLYMFVCLALALPRARALTCNRGFSAAIIIIYSNSAPKRLAWFGRARVRADKVHTDIVPLLLVFISLFYCLSTSLRNNAPCYDNLRMWVPPA